MIKAKSSTDYGTLSTAHHLELQPLFSSDSGEEVKIHEFHLQVGITKSPVCTGLLIC